MFLYVYGMIAKDRMKIRSFIAVFLEYVSLRFQRLFFARLVTLAALVSFLSPSLPTDLVWADSDDALAGIPIGTAGQSPSPSPALGSPEGLAMVDLMTGSARMSYPFVLPRARGDAQPGLALRYDSSSGVGFAGVGWTLDLPSIVRKGHSGIPRFQDPVPPISVQGSAFTEATDFASDDYYIGGTLLVPVQLNPSLPARIPDATQLPGARPWVLFRSEVDDGARYFFDGVTWVKQTKNGHLLQFGTPLDGGSASLEQVDGTTAQTQSAYLLSIKISGFHSPIYRWNLVRDTDASGNTVYYVWDDQHRLLGADSQNANAPVPTAGTMYLTDIYDTSNTPRPTPPRPSGPSTRQFAHHVHLTWQLPSYPGYPTDLSQYGVGRLVAPYAYSPIWKALPFAQLATVDVFSATLSSADRQLVREYQLQYTWNNTQTRSFLYQIQLVGDCDSIGGIAEARLTASIVARCVAAEKYPPMMFNYYGISPPDPRIASEGGPAPVILREDGPPVDGLHFYTYYIERYGYDPVFLVDFTGDGAAELLIQGGSTLGPPIQGGDTSASPYTPVTNTCIAPANMLRATSSSDWSYSIMGDWQATGRNSVLEVLPPEVLASFSSGSLLPVYLWQVSSVTGFECDFQWQSLMPELTTTDVANLQFLLGYNGGPPSGLRPGSLMGSRAFDVDGDGIPDMTLVPASVAGATIGSYATYFTSRDRSGVTHPFQIPGAGYFPSPDLDPTIPPFGGSTSESTAVRAVADVDGDGLADVVVVNKYDANFNIGSNGPPAYVGLLVLPSRGDGRFGVPNNVRGEPWQGFGNVIVPGTSPAANPTPPSDTLSAHRMQDSTIRFGDFNGDGFADFAVLDDTGLYICLRYGAWWDSAHWQCVLESHLPLSLQPPSTQKATILIGDLDGSGINQVVYFPGGPGNAARNCVSGRGGSRCRRHTTRRLTTERVEWARRVDVVHVLFGPRPPHGRHPCPQVGCNRFDHKH
jgi:YD repeat-containing protein